MSSIDEFKQLFQSEIVEVGNIPFISVLFMGKSIYDVMLSNEDIAKNMIKQRNPNLSDAEIGMMVEGVNDEQIEESLPGYDKLRSRDLDSDFLNTCSEDVFRDVYKKISKKNARGLNDERKALYDELKSEAQSPISDISADIPESITDEVPTGLLESVNISLKLNTKQKADMVKQKYRDTINGVKDHYTNMKEQLNKDIEEKKKTFVIDLKDFTTKVKEIIPATSEASMIIGTSISGAVMMVSTPVFPTPSFNIPGMMTLLLTAKKAIDDLLSKIGDARRAFVKLFDVLDLFPIGLVTAIVTILVVLIKTIKSLGNILGNGSKKMSEGMDEAMNEQRNLYNEKKNDTYINDDGEEENKFPDSMKSIIEKTFGDFSAMRTETEAMIKNIGDITSELSAIGSKITYDIHYPDGTIVSGVTMDYIEGIKDEYDIEYN